ncbi:Uncharacterized protein C7orf50-like protein [Colletotrichum chlorophyti]|uniref:Uncharacterized protein C7orf50-like protein n=1 Tax=Colletotrichum chlorophyti TaxID=708187 RepID=A0A1Q8RZC2_9PEZI|nr:Uncharacterized protein C7orf50-like protein [Colletotrichum chlorophyti]
MSSVPAWKRLGLKLKQPASGAEIGGPASAEGSKPNGQQHHDRNASGPVSNAAYDSSSAAAAAAKRKRPDHFTPPASSSPFKRTRTDGSDAATPTLRKQKSVTFTDDTKKTSVGEPTNVDKKKKKNKGPKKPATQQPQADIKPSLEYLRTWKSARSSWKFNKNHQTILMKRVFSTDSIPSSDIDTFYDYIQDLKGFTRTRLKETAAEVKKEDTEKGKAGFPEGTPDMDSKQSEYEKVLAGLMQLNSGSKRKRFDEADFVTQSTDVAVAQRVVKRMRAETILEELSSESDDSDAMTVDTEEKTAPAQTVVQEEVVDKRVKLNDGTKQNAPRRRKLRTANADDSSSEESSDEDSDDDSSSDSSSSDDSDDEDEVRQQAAQREAETSSSSSSSSEDSDSSSEDDSEEEEETTKERGAKRS